MSITRVRLRGPQIPFSKVALTAGILLYPADLASQARSATFDIFVAGTVVGTEVYNVSGSGTEGPTIRSETVMRSTLTRVTLEARYDPEWRPSQIQYTSGGTAARRAFLQFSARRVTFRAISAEGERAREMPASGTVVVVHDSLPSLFVALAGQPPGNVIVFEPETGERSSGLLIDHGPDETHPAAAGQPLRHLELQTRGGSRHAWFDDLGALMRVEIPHLTLVATPHDVR